MLDYNDGNGHMGHIYGNNLSDQIHECHDELTPVGGITGYLLRFTGLVLRIGWWFAKLGIRIMIFLIKVACHIVFSAIGWIFNYFMDKHLYEHSTGHVHVDNWDQPDTQNNQNVQNNDTSSQPNYFNNDNFDENDDFNKYMK